MSLRRLAPVLAVLCASLLGPVACRSTGHYASINAKNAQGKPRRFRVYKADVLELEIVAGPGPLVSNSAPPPPPGSPPPKPHPFLSAVAFVPTDEGDLRAVLDASTSLGDFLDRLEARGLRIEEVE